MPGTPRILSGTVGRGGVNQADDVRLIQGMLNGWRSRNGLPAIRLDGIIGPETLGAIAAFQSAMRTGSDSRIDPGGPTLAALFRQYFQAVADQLAVGLHRYPGTVDHSTDQPPATRADLEREIACQAERLKAIQRLNQGARPAPGGPAARVA